MFFNIGCLVVSYHELKDVFHENFISMSPVHRGQPRPSRYDLSRGPWDNIHFCGTACDRILTVDYRSILQIRDIQLFPCATLLLTCLHLRLLSDEKSITLVYELTQ